MMTYGKVEVQLHVLVTLEVNVCRASTVCLVKRTGFSSNTMLGGFWSRSGRWGKREYRQLNHNSSDICPVAWSLQRVRSKLELADIYWKKTHGSSSFMLTVWPEDSHYRRHNRRFALQITSQHIFADIATETIQNCVQLSSCTASGLANSLNGITAFPSLSCRDIICSLALRITMVIVMMQITIQCTRSTVANKNVPTAEDCDFLIFFA